MFHKNLFTVVAISILSLLSHSCNQNQEEKVAQRYIEMVKSSTGKTVSVDEAKEKLKKLESEKAVQADEIEQTMNLLNAKYNFKVFPPDDLKGKMIFTFILEDYLLKEDRNILFVGQLDDITNEDGKFVIHLFSQLQPSDWQSRKRAHFHLRCEIESIESIINNPPRDIPGYAGFQKQFFVISKINNVQKATSYTLSTYRDEDRNEADILVNMPNEYQIQGDLVDIIPYSTLK